LVAMRLKADEVGGVTVDINLEFPDIEQRWTLGLSNRAVHYRSDRYLADADLTVTTTRETLSQIVAGETTIAAAVEAGQLTADGDLTALHQIIDHLDVFMGGFPIIEP
jgi:alkyl sulfatase BDS1-like metallo-beta-lactamase superfamily hydrolase